MRTEMAFGACSEMRAVSPLMPISGRHGYLLSTELGLRAEVVRDVTRLLLTSYNDIKAYQKAFYGYLAQLVERTLRMREVRCSNRLLSIFSSLSSATVDCFNYF